MHYEGTPLMSYVRNKVFTEVLAKVDRGLWKLSGPILLSSMDTLGRLSMIVSRE